MKRFLHRVAAFAAVALAGFFGSEALAVGWPANYDGVMLQGFYWDSYKTGGGFGTTKWTDLTNQADELSQYFDLIWIPNSARGNGEGGGGNGYMPIYWFTNHNCAYGTEAQLKTMISTFKAKGTGFIEDVVVNHRVGVSNWYNFPKETWNGKTYELTNGAICSTDEMWRDGGHGCPYTRGNSDTGEDFDGARDLDHTNATVQSHIKDYCKFLIDDMGYVGFRLDMVKGYGGQYTKIYNQYSKPRFSVGEYFDSSYDAVAAWIEATGKESAAFDFPCKYQINKALGGGENLNELVWKANGTTDQPAGLIHYGYPQLAVTFVDNHDTFRDGSKFTGNVLAANAFILLSPGTPCVFWPHYYANKTAIQNLIKARKAVGIHNQSAVRVLQTSSNIYVAEVTGKKGKAIVKIGSGNYNAPAGYNLFTSGNNYAVWTTTSGGVTPTPDPDPQPTVPSQLYLQGHVNGYDWSTSQAVPMTKSGNKFSATVTIDDSGDGSGYFSFATVLGADWDAVNGGDRFGASSADESISNNSSASMMHYPANVTASGCQSWKITPGKYTITADFGSMKVIVGEDKGGNQGGGNQGGIGSDLPAINGVYLNNTAGWQQPYVWAWSDSGNTCDSGWPGDQMTKVSGNIWKWEVPAGKTTPTGIIFSGGGDDTKTADLTYVNGAVYDCTGSVIGQSGGNGGNQGGGNQGGGNQGGTAPAQLYMIGNVNGAGWATNKGEKMAKSGDTFTATVTIDDAGEGSGYFSFCEQLGMAGADDWDDGVNQGNRYGAAVKDTPVQNNNNYDIRSYLAGVDASACESWMIAAGKYTFTVDFSNMKLYIGKYSGIDSIDGEEPVDAVYFNLQGQKINEPLAPGIYIRVRGQKADKILVK